MTRLSVAAVLCAWLAGPFGGCDRAPVTPPAAPPPERAPAQDAGDGGVILKSDRHRFG